MKTLFLKKNNDTEITFFFNSGSGFHRPLWTYKDIVSKIDSYYYFYSYNSATNKLSKDLELKNKKDTVNIFSLLSWDNYLTCSEEQIENLKKNLSNYNYTIENIGNISFEGNKKFFKKTKELIVSVFDVSAYRPRFILYEQMPYYYYTYKNVNKFYEDIFDVFGKLNRNWKIVVKQKRPLIKLKSLQKDSRHMKFSQLSVLDNNKNIKRIEDNINVNSIITNSDLVISMPYTTPSSIAKESGVKTFFYDPVNLFPNYALTKNIPLISNKESIYKFIEENFNSN